MLFSIFLFLSISCISFFPFAFKHWWAILLQKSPVTRFHFNTISSQLNDCNYFIHFFFLSLFILPSLSLSPSLSFFNSFFFFLPQSPSLLVSPCLLNFSHSFLFLLLCFISSFLSFSLPFFLAHSGQGVHQQTGEKVCIRLSQLRWLV